MWFEDGWVDESPRIQFTAHGYYSGDWSEEETLAELLVRMDREFADSLHKLGQNPADWEGLSEEQKLEDWQQFQWERRQVWEDEHLESRDEWEERQQQEFAEARAEWEQEQRERWQEDQRQEEWAEDQYQREAELIAEWDEIEAERHAEMEVELEAYAGY